MRVDVIFIASLIVILVVTLVTRTRSGQKLLISANYNYSVSNVSLKDTLAKDDSRPFRSGDYAYVVSTHDRRHKFVEAGRSWRKGVPTVVATNVENVSNQFNAEHSLNRETWLFYKDVNKSKFLGDCRAAMAPLLAYRELYDNKRIPFKWLLLGDDDTIFFSHGVELLTMNLDHNLPYFISDNVYNKINAEDAKAEVRVAHVGCLPCNFNEIGLTPHALCGAIQTCNCSQDTITRIHPSRYGGDSQDCHAFLPFSYDGGGGAILSSGLLKRLNYTFMEQCIVDEPQNCNGGDCLLSHCLFKAGWAITKPGHELRYNGEFLFDHANRNPDQLFDSFYKVFMGQCDEDCRRSILHMVTLHVSPAGGDIFQGSLLLRRLSLIYDSVVTIILAEKF